VERSSIQQLRDQGSLCLRSTPDGVLSIDVTFPGCLSSSCDTVISKSCSVERTGNEILVHSQAEIEHAGEICTDDCGVATAQCTASSVDAGEYTLIHGDDRAQVTLPGDGALLFNPTGVAQSRCD
jgi:hypothetical protein